MASYYVAILATRWGLRFLHQKNDRGETTRRFFGTSAHGRHTTM